MNNRNASFTFSFYSALRIQRLFLRFIFQALKLSTLCIERNGLRCITSRTSPYSPNLVNALDVVHNEFVN
jgi:hypothetical protein